MEKCECCYSVHFFSLSLFFWLNTNEKCTKKKESVLWLRTLAWRACARNACTRESIKWFNVYIAYQMLVFQQSRLSNNTFRHYLAAGWNAYEICGSFARSEAIAAFVSSSLFHNDIHSHLRAPRTMGHRWTKEKRQKFVKPKKKTWKNREQQTLPLGEQMKLREPSSKHTDTLALNKNKTRVTRIDPVRDYLCDAHRPLENWVCFDGHWPTENNNEKLFRIVFVCNFR